MGSPAGYSVRYASCRALDADHAAYITHGGLVLSADPAPALNSVISVRIDAPGDRSFSLIARVGQEIPGRGVMVTFEGSTRRAQMALDRWVQASAFQEALKGESGEPIPPVVEILAADDKASLPAASPAPAAPRRTKAPAASTPSPSGDSALHPDLEAILGAPPAAASTDDTAALHPDLEAALAQPERRPGNALHPDIEALATPLGSGSSAGADVELRRPEAGETYWVFVVKFTKIKDFVLHTKELKDQQRFTIPHKNEQEAKVGEPLQLRLTLPGHNVFNLWGNILQIQPQGITVKLDPEERGLDKAIAFPGTVNGKKRFNREDDTREEVVVVRLTQEVPKEDFDKLPIRRRLARMGMDDKINLALSGGREERMALAMDSNKAVHHYLLKNARISLDEVALMARLPSLNPDVLDKIAENPSYTQNPTIVKALVYNPRTPVKTAIRLVDRLPRSEVMNLAKRTNMNKRLVMAAKKRVEKRRI